MMERRGLPAAPIGVEKLVMTTGRGMARAQGLGDLGIAALVHDSGIITSVEDEHELAELILSAASQVENILLRPDVPRKIVRLEPGPAGSAA